MKHGKKVLALLLAITLCLPLLPSVQANAELRDLPEICSYEDAGFTDVKDDWSKPGIVAAYELGLMSGKGAGIFDPDGHVTIAEVVMVAAKVHNLWLGKDSNIPAGKDSWYGGGLDICMEEGIVKEREFASFTLVATRAQVAGILARSLPESALPQQNEVTALPDVVSATPYSPEIFILYRAGVINGTTADGAFNPYGQLTRKELAAMLCKLAKPSMRGTFSFTASKTPSADKTVYSTDKILYMNECPVVGLVEIGSELYLPLKPLVNWSNNGMSYMAGISLTDESYTDNITLAAEGYGSQNLRIVDISPLPKTRRNLGQAGSYTGKPVVLAYQEAVTRSQRTLDITDQVLTLGGEYPMIPLSVLGIDLSAAKLEWNVAAQSDPVSFVLEKDLVGDMLPPLVSDDIPATLQAIHNAIINKITYDPDWNPFVIAEPTPAVQASIDAKQKAMEEGFNLGNNLTLASGYGVCENYASLFMEMCLRAGIPCRKVFGSASGGMPHTWNKVWTGSAWLYVDCTFDDPTGGMPQLLQTYFLKDAAFMAQDHYWEEIDYPG